MRYCKKTIIAACFSIVLPLTCWSAAPVVDDSDNFAMAEEQQRAEEASAASGYDELQIEEVELDTPHRSYKANSQIDDEPALAHDDQGNNSNIGNNAKLIDKLLNLQQQVQELRGQLEVQAHDLKLLQQQQIAFYKDLDARIGQPGSKADTAPKVATISKTPSSQLNNPALGQLKVEQAVLTKPIAPASKTNPADEQISYLAAYELVKDKKFDEAIRAMQIFVQKYPNGGYTANAQYWLGELYLVKKDYLKSIDHFETVLKQFPSSSKSAASMLKAGYAYAAKGNNLEAKKRFQQVIENYPNTSTAQLATAKLDIIKAL